MPKPKRENEKSISRIPINTALRTEKAHTILDGSGCSEVLRRLVYADKSRDGRVDELEELFGEDWENHCKRGGMERNGMLLWQAEKKKCDKREEGPCSRP